MEAEAQNTDIARRSPEREISRAVVEVYKSHLDRGPERVRTTIEDEFVVCVLEGCLSRGEKRLVASSRGSTVRGIRREYQDAMKDEIVAAVELATGRTAAAFLSDHDPAADVAVEVVKLEPIPRLAIAES